MDRAKLTVGIVGGKTALDLSIDVGDGLGHAVWQAGAREYMAFGDIVSGLPGTEQSKTM